MKVKIKFIYANQSFRMGIKAFSSFKGKGSALIDETGLILEGEVPKLNLGWLFRVSFVCSFVWFLYRNVIAVKTIKLIPYMRIIKYKKPNFMRRSYLITYKLPNGKIDTIRFKVLKLNNLQRQEFYEKLESYLNIKKTVL